MSDFNPFAEDFDLDGEAILAALGDIDPNAKQSDAPPPPPDGIYNIRVVGAPIDKDGPYKGKIVKPFVKKDASRNDLPELNPSKDGKQNATLYINIFIEGPEGQALTRRTIYPNSMVASNGTSDVMALAKALGFIEGETVAEYGASIIAFIKSQREDIEQTSDATFVLNNTPWLLTEALGVQIARAGEAGLRTTAVVKSVFMAETGKMGKDGRPETKPLITGSDNLLAAGYFKGGPQTTKEGKTGRVELVITDFGTPLEG